MSRYRGVIKKDRVINQLEKNLSELIGDICILTGCQMLLRNYCELLSGVIMALRSV